MSCVAPASNRKRIHKGHRKRFTSRERMKRIYKRIYKSSLPDAREKGITIRQIARRERISTSRAYYYLRLIRRKRGVKIERLGKKFYYLKPTAPGRRKELKPQRGDVEVRGYWNYNSPDYPARNLNIDCVAVVSDNPNAILAAKARIEALVRHRLGGKVAEKLHYGVSPATPESRNHFLYRRGGGKWLDL